MVKRAFLFVILSALTGVIIGNISFGAFVQNKGNLSDMASIYWAIVGAIHGLVLFFSSLGESPVIEDTRRGKFVVSSLADSFDYRRFGHRILYISIVFGLLIAFLVSELLANAGNTEVTSIGMRLLSGIAISFIWTAVQMIIDIVIVSKIALN